MGNHGIGLGFPQDILSCEIYINGYQFGKNFITWSCPFYKKRCAVTTWSF